MPDPREDEALTKLLWAFIDACPIKERAVAFKDLALAYGTACSRQAAEEMREAAAEAARQAAADSLSSVATHRALMSLPLPSGAKAPETWRPIASAPKDGTKIDVWVNGERWPNVSWRDIDHTWDETGFKHKEPAFRDYDGTVLQPTHSLPLPSPPVPDVGEK